VDDASLGTIDTTHLDPAFYASRAGIFEVHAGSIPKVKIVPAIMSGGAGTRLWPLSTEAMPKQFHRLGSEATLMQETILRLVESAGIQPASPIVICGQQHCDVVDAQLTELGLKPSAIVQEPFGRNTAVVAAMAALLAQESEPDALVLLMPADHIIADKAHFSEGLAKAAPVARERIVVFGVDPTAPETGYGYIESGADIDGYVREVVRFTEKPDLETAKAYLAGGRHTWNAGIFLFSPAVLLGELERHAPEVKAAAELALAKAVRTGPMIALDRDAFDACPSISIDYAIMEKTDRAAVAPLGVGWADIGSWSEVWRLGPHDERGNTRRGSTVLIDTDGSLVWATDKTVGVIGLQDLIVVQTEDAVIVLPRSRAQDVKLLVDQVRAKAAAARGAG
jgi:mannose-1-phosphate guanylyltransferase/mannose-6-phosphate isomerase